MANTLTGDFDIVAEFAIPAVNRVLAAMHQTGRFLHSISANVDDSPHPTQPGRPTAVGVVDAFGDAVANQNQIGSPNPTPGPSAVTDPVNSRLGVILNPSVLGFAQPQITPSHISGIAQLQLSPPTLAVPQTANANLTVTTNIISRFFPDKGTAPLAEFMRGDLQISAPINKVVSGGVRVIDIDFKADQATITFTPSYSSKTLSPEDLAGINLCIQNGLRTSFLPSSVKLPAAIADLHIKTLPGTLAVLLDLYDHTPASTAGSVNSVFLNGEDDFAFAVGSDYLFHNLRLISDNILSQQLSPAKFTLDYGFGTLHYSYPITLSSAAFSLQPPDKIVLTVDGNAGPEKNHSPKNFPFTVTVEFSLVPSGPTVGLQLGNVSVDLHGLVASVVGWLADASGAVKSQISAAVAATGAGTAVDQMFNADTNLGTFLNTQLNPSDGNPPAEPQQLFFVYNSVAIQPDGIVLHGSLLVFDWPTPYVEFEQIPPNPNVHVAPGVILPQASDYSALKTWIPGGTITRYQWSVQGQEQAYPFDVDPNRFVLLHSRTGVIDPEAMSTPVPGYAPLCLTITGSRISNYGSPIAYQPVTAYVCGVTKFHVGGLVGLSAGGSAIPMFAITRPGPGGEVVVSGHASAEIERSGRSAPNLIVHFADSKSVSQLQTLTQALQQSKRTDAPTAVIAALTRDQLSKARFASGIAYADDQDSWQTALGLKVARPPLTLIVSPKGEIVWQHEGALEAGKLAAALAKHLVKRGPVRVAVPRLNVRTGQPTPNFLFEYVPGREMPLSKLKGQPLILVFWRSSVKPSIAAVRDLQSASASGKTPAGMVLAINDGEDPQVARAVAAESGITATVVTDPKREISEAYGVSLWPTIVTVGASGAVTGIRYGHLPGENGRAPSKPPSAHSR